MKINKNSLVLAAAFTGLLGGTMARLNAAPASGSSLSAVLQAADSSDKKDDRKARLQGIELVQGQRRRIEEGVGQELLQGKGRLRHRRLQAAKQVTSPPRGAVASVRRPLFSNICQPIDLTDSRITGSASVCGFLITPTSSKRNP